MAAVFSSKSVRHAHSAKPSLLRPLLWTLGIQTALGGTLVMIHDKVFPEGTETGTVTMSFTDAGEDSGQSGFTVKPQVRVLPPAVAPARMEGTEIFREVPLASAGEVPMPNDLPSAEKNSELFLSHEDFGTLLGSGRDTASANRNPSRTTKAKGNSTAGLVASSSSSSAKGNSAATSARYKSAPLPPYPRSARSEGREGVVMLKLLIDEEGIPVQVDLAKSSGSSVLDDAALAWVKNNWLFYPATDGTAPVESAMIAPLRFTLNS